MSAPKVVLYHNPACSKSRDAVAALKTRKVDTEVVEYLKAPLTEEEVRSFSLLILPSSTLFPTLPALTCFFHP